MGDGGMHSEDNIRVIEKELQFKAIVGVPLFVMRSCAVPDGTTRSRRTSV